jgi:hypothetical protein
MNRKDYYTQQGWDGICQRCGHDYINGCHGDCTCLACNLQRQGEVKEGLSFTDVDLPPLSIGARSIPYPPNQCRCGGSIIVARTPDEAFCEDCGRRYAHDGRYGWITP